MVLLWHARAQMDSLTHPACCQGLLPRTWMRCGLQAQGVHRNQRKG